MKIFLKRVWGFTPEPWPVIAFGKKGDCTNLIDRSFDGDLIACLATKGEETSAQDHGRLLGLVEFELNIVKTLDFVSEDRMTKNAMGDDKWHHAVRMRRAWRFLDKPLGEGVLRGKMPPMAGVAQCHLLDDDDAKAILDLAREVVPVGPGSK